MMMDALVKATASKGLELKRVPVPECGHNDVLIKIHKTAICGTDLHIYNWDLWSQKHVNPPCVIGHEYVGEIAAMGAEVRGFELGQIVSGEGHLICGHCRNCRAGNGHWCHATLGVGVQRDGAFAEYLCIPASNCIPISHNISEEVVSFFDAFGNATHTALMFDVVGEDVLVTGAGPIGMMAAAICKHNGARNVMITDINDYRLELAKKLSDVITVNVSREKLDEAMAENGMVEGFDVGLEMSGSLSAFKQMVGKMRNGGKIALLGLFGGKPIDIEIDEVILKSLTLQGVYGRRMYETWYKMGAMVESGLNLTPLITHRFHYKDFQQAFDIMNTGNNGKVILEWGAGQ